MENKMDTPGLEYPDSWVSQKPLSLLLTEQPKVGESSKMAEERALSEKKMAQERAEEEKRMGEERALLEKSSNPEEKKESKIQWVKNPTYVGNTPAAMPWALGTRTSEFRGQTPQQVMEKMGLSADDVSKRVAGPQSRSAVFDKLSTDLHHEAVEKAAASKELKKVDEKKSDELASEVQELVDLIGMLTVESAKQVKKELELVPQSEVEKRSLEEVEEEGESDKEKSKKRKK